MDYTARMFAAALPDVFFPPSSDATDPVDELTLRNRAYQVLYALGEDSSTVRTLTTGEAACLVAIVQQLTSAPQTELDRVLVSKMSPRMIDYIAGGGIQ